MSVPVAQSSTLVISDPRVPRDLVAAYDSGQALTVAGRNSSPSGAKAYKEAANDLHGAVESLALIGIDLRGFVPPKSQICADLKAAQPVKSDRFSDGKPVTHRFVEYDFQEVRARMIVCAGNATQVDDSALQPWVTRLGASLKQSNSCLLWVKERHRLGRSAWAVGPLMTWIQASGAWLGSPDRPLTRLDSPSSMQLFFDMMQAEETGNRFPIEARNGMRRQTDPAMVDGRAMTGVGYSPPAGLCIIRMKAATGKGPSIMFLDTPANLPPADEVAYGRPEALDDQDRPADQVAAVRWMLANAFQPGVRRTDLCAELGRRGFATHTLRHMRGRADVTIRDIDVPNAHGMVRTVLSNLEFYRTGVLKIRFGVEGVEDFDIEGCLPPGGWATDEDFWRIEQGLAGGPDQRTHHRFTFAGLRVRFEGHDFVLRSRPRYVDRLVDSAPAYYLKSIDGHRAPGFSIPHTEIAQWFVDGIAAAGDRALPLVGTGTVSAEGLELRSRLTNEQAALAVLEEQEARLLEKIMDSEGPLNAQLQRRYNQELSPSLDDARAALRATQTAIDSESRRVLSNMSSMAADRLLHFVAELSDPTSGQFRSVLIPSTNDIVYERLETRRYEGLSVEHRLTGALRVGSGEMTVDLALERSWSSGAATELAARVPDILEQLRSGVPFVDVDVPMAKYAKADVAEALGVETGKFVLPRILDPRISAAIANLLYFREGRSVAEVASDLGEPIKFVERVEDLYVTNAPPPRWFRGSPRYLVAMYASASLHDGLSLNSDVAAWAGSKRGRVSNVVADADDGFELVYGVGYQIPSCAFCGSHHLTPSRVREPAGPICADCRLDRSGVEWSSEFATTYLAEPGIWNLAQFSVTSKTSSRAAGSSGEARDRQS